MSVPVLTLSEYTQYFISNISETNINLELLSLCKMKVVPINAVFNDQNIVWNNY